MTADNERGFKPPKCTLNQKANASKRLHQSIMYPEGGERSLQEESSVSPSTPKKHRWVKKQPKTSLIWKGLIQMFSVKQFVAEAYPVSGSSGQLCQGLPHLLQSRGCILPEDVWVYLDSMWPANSKEMGVIQFYPSLSKDFNPYNMLYSYLNNKQRYGIVDSNQMEIFMVPLAAYQPVPSKLHPLGGPGLDPSHPSLLLGLILPKRTCTGTFESRPNPVPKAKRKSVTFKDSIETKYFALPLHSQEDPSQTGPLQPLSMDRLLCGNEGPLMGLLRQEPLTIDALHNLTEELGRQMLHQDPSCLHQKKAEDEANPSLLGDTLQLLHDAPWTEGQLGHLTLESLGTQPPPEEEQVQFCIESDPSHFWNTLGLLLPSESLCSQQHGPKGGGRGGENILEVPFLSSMLCAETGLLSEVSQLLSSAQIPCTRCSPGEPNSLVEETLSLIQHVKQLQSHMQNQEPQPAATFSLPVMPQEITSALSQAVAGLEFPPVQLDGGTDAQLQLLLSNLMGQTQSSSAV
ncbi:SPOC domain-containing protein 1 [Elgaria multicarinata webbii]|uniref:SPOC domain-containing protein 1 n=1 Tax=Elgaria multicarinata webbii TaxID=159646 RepID=UPI002FCD5AFC